MSKQFGIPAVVVTVLGALAFVASWSSGFVIAAVATVEVSPITLLVWRFVPVAVALLIVVNLTGAARGISRADLTHQAIVGVFAQFGYCAFVYASIATGITTGTTALIDAVQPLIVATLVGPLLGVRVRGAQWGGLVMGAFGVALVVRSQFGEADAPPLAYALPALAMVSLIVGTFIERRSTSRVPVLVTLTVHVVVTAVAFVLLGAGTGTLLPPASPLFWLNALLAAVFPTLVAYGLYWWLLRRVGITALNALLFLVAPATALAGAALLGEPLGVVTFIGFALCAAGVAAVLISESRERPAPTTTASPTTTANPTTTASRLARAHHPQGGGARQHIS
ncbi:MAG TPA: DMT family transporter [Glaciihabitans sp.]|jgi:drug/metabolite transporter (DMT)-like permease|nr:DMT family transporter [Glaciihabitans sp.]